MSPLEYGAVIRGWSPDLIRVFPEERYCSVRKTGSTNDDLLELLKRGRAEHLSLIQADHQTKGRGRRGDRWEAPSGSNLLFSLSLRLPEERDLWTRLPHLAAKVIGEAVESVLPGEMRLQAKWPNDLLVSEKKVAGILVETVLTPVPFAVVGVGLNVNVQAKDFSEELREIATSLYEILGCESSRAFLLGLIVQGFIKHFPNGLKAFDEVRTWLGDRDFLEGKKLRIIASQGQLEGVGEGLGENGELLLRSSQGGLERIISSEKIELC